MGWMTTSSPGRGKNFHFSMSSRPALGPTQSPIQWAPWALSPWVKWPGCEVDHWPPTSAKGKHGSIHPLPHTSSWPVKHRDNFTLCLYLSPTYLLTYVRSWALPEKLPIVQPFRKFPAILRNPKVNHRVHKSPPLVPMFHYLFRNKKFWEELIGYVPLIRCGPHRKWRVQQFLYYCVFIRCCS
jgi:hypothetical protein